MRRLLYVSLALVFVNLDAHSDQSNRRFPVARTLQIHLMAGQSNMTGQAHVFQEGDDFLALQGDPDATSLEFLLNNPAYVASLSPSTYPVLSLLDPSWMLTRQEDVWGIHLQALNGTPLEVRTGPSSTLGTWTESENTMGIGFGGVGFIWSRFGIELAMGRILKAVSDQPQYIFKVDTAGTRIDTHWRPPSAGGTVGTHYVNMMTQFQAFLASLDADLADDGYLNDHGDATAYEITSFTWWQGANNRGDGQANLDLYRDLQVDLVNDVRADLGVPNLPMILVEHAQVDRVVELDGTLSGADGTVSQAKKDAIDILELTTPGTVFFVRTNDLLSTPNLNDPFHFEKRAENYLQVGWRVARELIGNELLGTTLKPAKPPLVVKR
tara:strand:- start:8432 stop:9577 length:1146 start_codon:yes stop_codon:yes gene_type:complete